MNKIIDLPKLPKKIKVHVIKGESGSLLANLPDYGVFTESDNLNDLVFQVNDLIYTLFDVPQKYHDGIFFKPDKIAQNNLVRIASIQTHQSSGNFTLTSFYSPEVFDVICRSSHA